MANKRNVRVPSRSRVDILASELRMGGYQNDVACFELLSKPTSLMEYEMWPNAHDSMNDGHVGNFKRLGWLVGNLCPSDDLRIRIFDVEGDGTTSTVIVHQQSESFSEIPLNVSLNLVVIDNHLRFLQHSEETFPGSWKERKSTVQEAKNLPG